MGAGVDVEARAEDLVISRHQAADFERLVGVAAAPPPLVDFLQADDVGAAKRFAYPHQVDLAVESAAELDIVTDDFHALPAGPAAARPSPGF